MSPSFCLFQNWKKELEKHREKLLGGNESSSKKKEVSYFQFGTAGIWNWFLQYKMPRKHFKNQHQFL